MKMVSIVMRGNAASPEIPRAFYITSSSHSSACKQIFNSATAGFDLGTPGFAAPTLGQSAPPDFVILPFNVVIDFSQWMLAADVTGGIVEIAADVEGDAQSLSFTVTP